MSDCIACGRAGEPYVYHDLEFDGLCAWHGEKICPSCRDARLELLGQAAGRAPVTPRVKNGYGPPLGHVAEVKLPICSQCWHDTGSHCGDGAHLEDRFGPVCTGGGIHCEQCPGNRCQLMVPVRSQFGQVVMLIPAKARETGTRT
jgi:hypothetical protein